VLPERVFMIDPSHEVALGEDADELAGLLDEDGAAALLLHGRDDLPDRLAGVDARVRARR
jgi:hypothetical protein